MRTPLFAVLTLVLGLAVEVAGQERNGPVHFFFNRGCAAYFRGDYLRALENLELCVRHDDDPRYFYFRGLAHYQLGDWAAADADFQRGAALELRRIDFGDLVVDEVRRLAQVSRSLERVQGAARLQLERHRQLVYLSVNDVQAHKNAQIEAIQRAALAALEEQQRRAAERPKTLQDIVGEIIEIDGAEVRVLNVVEYQGGIQSLVVIDADIPLKPRLYARTAINTGERFVTGREAVEYLVRRDSRTYSAAELLRLEHERLPAELVFNPLYNILSDRASAEAGWEAWRRIEAERVRREIAARRAAEERRALEERQRLAEQRRREQERLARQIIEGRSHRGGNGSPYVRDVNLPPLVKVAGAIWLHGMARDADEREGKFAAIVNVGSRVMRDWAIRSVLADILPDADRGQLQQVQMVMSLLADGQLDIRHLSEELAKQAIKDELYKRDSRLGTAAEVVDFLYQVYRQQSDRH
jgi:hypothetical protein